MLQKLSFLLISFSLFFISVETKCQSSCYYVEENQNSNGYTCEQDTLQFTNNVETYVRGGLSANSVIIIKPHSLYSIHIKPKDANCEICFDEGDGNGGITIKNNDRPVPGKGGNRKINTTTPQSFGRKIMIKKNPVKELLELSVPDNVTISDYRIYDSSKSLVKKSSNYRKTHPINCSNLASNILTIDTGKEKLTSWQLFDSSGKLMKTGNSNTINVQSIPNASYVLKINLEKTQISKIIIVKH